MRIYGAGGHSQVIRKVLELQGYEVTETFDDKPDFVHMAYDQSYVEDGARANLKSFPHAGPPVIVAIGNNKDRAEIASFLKTNYGKVIHPSAIIAKNTEIDLGTVVFAGAIIQPNTTIGKHVIINTGASVDHDIILGDFVLISPKVALCGHVEVGQGTHIGVGAVVIPKIKIGRWCTIGAGSVIIRDVPDFTTVVGNPGKIIKTERIELKLS